MLVVAARVIPRFKLFQVRGYFRRVAPPVSPDSRVRTGTKTNPSPIRPILQVVPRPVSGPRDVRDLVLLQSGFVKTRERRQIHLGRHVIRRLGRVAPRHLVT